MLAVSSLLMLLSTTSTFNPLPKCQFDSPVEFSEDLKDLPDNIQADFMRRVGKIHPVLTKSTTKNTGPLRYTPGNKLIFIGKSGDHWIIYYLRDGGIIISMTMVGYIDRKGESFYLQGALNGEPCHMAKALFSKIGVDQRFDLKKL